MKKYLTILAALMLALNIFAAEKLAIAEPVGEGVSKEELSAFWSLLEANAGGEQYELITRGALQSMLTEIGLVESSGLTELSSAQKAKLGELKTVRYILVPKLGKLGKRYVVTLMVMDASTGEISPNTRVSETVESWTELADKLKSFLRNANLAAAPREYRRVVVLTPEIRTAAPEYVAEELSTGVESAILARGIKLQNLKNAAPILRKNGIGELNTIEPDLYAKVGDLLKVDALVKIEVTRFSMRTEKKFIEVTQRTSIRHLGDISGSIRTVSAQTGEVIGSAPFAAKVDFDQLDVDTSDWEAQDFGRNLIQRALPEITVKVLQQLQK